jgi:hypothetical protein
MLRRFLAVALLATGGATLIHAQPSLPSSFQAKTIHSPEADIFVRWGGKGPVVVLIHGYAEKQRLVGSSGRGSYEGSYRPGPGPSWNWQVIEA